MKAIIIVPILLLAACTDKKTEILEQIKVKQNLVDSLKRVASHEVANTDYSKGADFKKLADYDKQIQAANKSIDSLNLELKKY